MPDTSQKQEYAQWLKLLDELQEVNKKCYFKKATSQQREQCGKRG